MNTPTSLLDTFQFFVWASALFAIVAALGVLSVGFSRGRLWQAFGVGPYLKGGHLVFLSGCGLSAMFLVLAVFWGLVRDDLPLTFLTGAVGLVLGLYTGFKPLERTVEKEEVEARRGKYATQLDDLGEVYFASPGLTLFLPWVEDVVAKVPQVTKISATKLLIEAEAADGVFVIEFRLDGTIGSDDDALRAFIRATNADLDDEAARRGYIVGQATDRFKAFVGGIARNHSIPANVRQKLKTRPPGGAQATEPEFPSTSEFSDDDHYGEALGSLEFEIIEEFGFGDIEFRLVNYDLSEENKKAANEAFENAKKINSAADALRRSRFLPPEEAEEEIEQKFRRRHGLEPTGQLTQQQAATLDQEKIDYRKTYEKKLKEWLKVNAPNAHFHFYEVPEHVKSLGVIGDEDGDDGGGGIIAGGRQPHGGGGHRRRRGKRGGGKGGKAI